MRRERVCFGENQWAVLLNEKRSHRVGLGTNTVISAIISSQSDNSQPGNWLQVLQVYMPNTDLKSSVA
jgi:hypothetical protein